MIFIHKKTGEVMDVNEAHKVYPILCDSPSWELEKELKNPDKEPDKELGKTTKK